MIKNLKNRRIIVTGAGGIIGLALSKRLAQEGAHVFGLVRKAPKENIKGVSFIKGDLLSNAFLAKAFKQACSQGPVSMVFHLAGQSDANQCELDPVMAFEQNTLMTVKLLEASVKGHIKRFIFPSTAYVYGTDYQKKIKESFPVNPGPVYTLTKLDSEMIIERYAQMGKINADILRIGNVFGPQSKPNTVLGTMIAQAKLKGKITLRSLIPIRDFVFIDDVIEGFCRLAVSDCSGCHIYNFSIGQAVSVGQLAKLFCQAWGLPPSAVEGPVKEQAKASRLVLDNSALYNRLGWRPSISLREGLKESRKNVKT